MAPGKSEIRIRSFEPGDETAFRDLNEEWIAKYFGMEEMDHATLSDPTGKILRPGGRIFMALSDDRPVGTCALLPIETGVFEVVKMAVQENQRGRGIGRKLLVHAIEQARALAARRLYLETSKKLPNAVHLYESVGFRHLP